MIETKYILVLSLILFIAVYINYQNKLEGYQNVIRTVSGYNNIINYDGLSSGISPPWVVPDKIKRVAKSVVTGVLDKINKQYDTNLQMMKFDYIHNEEIDSGTHYIVDVFVHDKRVNEEIALTKRMIIDFIILKKGDVQINLVNSSNSKLPALGPSQNGDWEQPIDKQLIQTDEALLDNNNVDGGYESSSLEWSKYETDVKKRNYPNGSDYRFTILPVHLQEQYWHNYKLGMNKPKFSPTPYGDTHIINKNTWMFESSSRGMNRGNHY